MSQMIIPTPLTAAPSSFPPRPPPPPPPNTTNSIGKATRLRNLAASATKEANSKDDDVVRLEAAVKQARTDATFLYEKAKQLTRYANSLNKKPAGQIAKGLASEKLSQVRETRKHLKNAVAGQGRTGKHARRLEVQISLLEIALKDPQVSGQLLRESLKEMGEATAVLGALNVANASNPGLKHQYLSTTELPELDTDTDDLEILEDTAEVRALFEKKVSENATTPAKPDSQDSPSSSSAAHDLQAEQQILGELQTSAAPLRAQKWQEQEVQLKAARTRSQQLPEYRPTERDMALGLDWTLLSSETVRDDLEREIQHGGNQPYVAGHIAVMHRKLAILFVFAQKHDAPPDSITDEVDALEDALIRAKPLVNHASVREADKYLSRTDYRNSIHLTLRTANVRPLDVPIIRKRKRVNNSADSDTGSSKQDPFVARVKRRRMMEPQSDAPKALRGPNGRIVPHAAIRGSERDKSQSRGLLRSRYAHDSDDTRSLDDDYDLQDCELVDGLP